MNTMRHTLLIKYLAGETTATEEQKLRRLLLSMSQSQLTEEERTVLDLLSYAGEETDEEDIFAVDYTDEYDKVVRPRRTIRLWPYVAAACIAGAMFIFLTPPKEESLPQGGKQQAAHVMPDSISNELLAEELPTAKEEEQPTTDLPYIVGQSKAKHLVAKASIPTSSVEEEVSEEQGINEPVPSVSDDNVQLVAVETTEKTPPANIIITHPERLEYTPEEIEVLKRRAHEKYMEWIQLEQEILEADRRRTASME